MAPDALWVVNITCVVKGYQECRFDVKEGEEFKVSKKIGEKGLAFREVQENLLSSSFFNENNASSSSSSTLLSEWEKIQ